MRDDADPSDGKPSVYADKRELELNAQEEAIDALAGIESDLGDLMDSIDFDLDDDDSQENLLIDEDDDEEGKED